jgi:hypothetical protein
MSAISITSALQSKRQAAVGRFTIARTIQVSTILRTLLKSSEYGTAVFSCRAFAGVCPGLSEVQKSSVQ